MEKTHPNNKKNVPPTKQQKLLLNKTKKKKLRISTVAAIELLKNSNIKRTILWEIQAPDGSKHWLLGEKHNRCKDNPLSYFPKNSQLFAAIKKATVFMTEVTSSCDYDDDNTHNLTISGKIDAIGRKRNVKIVELDSRIARVKHLDEWIEAKIKNKSLPSERGLYLYDLLLKQNVSYLLGNLTLITKLQKKLDPDFRIITDRRNKMWARKIVKHCNKNERCLIYCGVGHVIKDSKSLVSLLKKKGFIFKRVD